MLPVHLFLLPAMAFSAGMPLESDLSGNSVSKLLNNDRKPLWKTSNANDGPTYGQPEQVHLSLTGDGGVYVTWVTFSDTIDSIVQYGIGTFDKNATGSTTKFVDGGILRTVRYIHRVVLTDVQAGQRYTYRVGSQYGWSSIYTFVGMQPRADGGYRYALYGDLGLKNARSLGNLQQLAQSGDIDLILHNGDFAYDMQIEEGAVGDRFMRQLEPVAAYVPYMTSVGNHEWAYNYSHYINRFTMPGNANNLYYSFDLGDAHFLVFCTEFYFLGLTEIPNLFNSDISKQYDWIVEDLKKANANRANVPWLITMAHRPMYCSTTDGDDCNNYESIIRTGVPFTHKYGLEKLFYDNGVDLSIWAHEHVYERLWPVYDRTVYNGTNSPYNNPPAPVHLLVGSAGCQENTDSFVKSPGPWSAFRSTDYGFGRMQIHNASHLYFEQVTASDLSVVDEIWLVKDSHGPYTAAEKQTLDKFGTHLPTNFCLDPKGCATKKN